MRVLLTGATGFLGSHVHRALLAAGHEVRAVRRSSTPRPLPRLELGQGGERASSGDERTTWRTCDMAMAVDPRHWLPLVEGCDAVINAVGLFREHRCGDFQRIHTDGPRALFEACVAAGVRRVVQVSALGADAGAVTPFHRTKHAGDEALLSLPLQGVVVQPSLIYGADGRSSQWFLTLASCRLIALPDAGRHLVQPIHVNDVADAIVALVEGRCAATQAPPSRVALVGPRSLTLANYLQALRAAMALGPAAVVGLPEWATRLVAAAGDRWSSLPVDRASLHMLRQGNTAPATALSALLGRPPRPVQCFVTANEATAVRTSAQLRWLLPLMRASLAVVWIVTAMLSAGLFPVAASRDLLAHVGVPSVLQLPALYGAAAFDLALGVLTLWPVRQGGATPGGQGQAWRLPGRRWLWRGQALLMLFYMAVIAVALPEFWLHPFGPLLKNVPMLAMLLMLDTLEPRDAGLR